MGQKLQFSKSCEKLLQNRIRAALCKKTALKNTYYSKNNTFYNMAKFGQYAKAIAIMKLSHWVKNENSQKDGKNYSRDALKLLCALVEFML